MDVVDESGTILFHSDNFKKAFGSETVGKKCWELYTDDKQQCQNCPLIKGINIGSTDILESQNILGGKVFEINHTGMMFRGKKAMLEIFHDITERKHAEANLIESKERAEESDRLKTAFLHNISHEIRTPMNAIVGFSNLLSDPNLSHEDQFTYTEIISKSSQHLLSIVNDVVEMANVEAGMLKMSMYEFHLNKLLSDLYQQFKPKADLQNIEFRFNAPDYVHFNHFQTDSTKLVQILSNLINNAFKFTPEGADPAADPEVDAETVSRLADFVRYLAPLPRRMPEEPDRLANVRQGERLFERVGCTKCHVPSLRTGPNDVAALDRKTASLYSDFLLHDMGPALASACGIAATPTEFRTEPLTGVSYRRRLLHDGSARNLLNAIRAHGGEATGVKASFDALNRVEQERILDFLRTL
jgi:PAS domain S-box-containing protein